LAFVSFCALLSLVGGGPDAFLGFLFFGFLLFGWVLVLLGGATGWLYGRRIKHSNPLPNADARDEAARAG